MSYRFSCACGTQHAKVYEVYIDTTVHQQKIENRTTPFDFRIRFACKTFMVSSVPKKKAQKRILETLRNEIDLLRSLDHPNIVRAYESYEVGRDLHLVMELCTGGGERCLHRVHW